MSQSTSRLVRNTVLLYGRMLVMLAVGLWTSRVVLAQLGVTDYGVNDVVGGVVGMLGMLTTSLSAAISRFITYELGRGPAGRLAAVFATSQAVMLAMAGVVLLVGETLGLWFLLTRLNVPAERLGAAQWVYQCGLGLFALGLVGCPYTASITAHERFDFYARITVMDAMVKLGVAFALLYSGSLDRLKLYSGLMAAAGAVVWLINAVYARRHFAYCRERPRLTGGIVREIGGFAGWNALGSGMCLLNTQGVNIASNLFFGVAVNAARGVAGRLDGLARQFALSFMTTLNPQITKSYAAGDLPHLHNLVCHGAKWTYLLSLAVAAPMMLETETVLELWLGRTPEGAALFARLSLVGLLFDLLGNATAVACWATGHVRRYYLWVSAVGSAVLPATYLMFRLGCPAWTAYVAYAVTYLALVFVKLWVIEPLIRMPMGLFVRGALLRVALPTVYAVGLGLVPFLTLGEGLARALLTGACCEAGLALGVWTGAADESEKAMIREKALAVWRRVVGGKGGKR